MNRSHRPLPLLLSLTAFLLLSGCGEDKLPDDDHDHDHADHDHSDDQAAARLMVSDAETGILRVIDLEDGAVLASYALTGPARLYTTESGRFAAAVQGGEANRVDFIDSGLELEPHGDHTHDRAHEPQRLDFHLAGADYGTVNPVHFVSHHGRITLHFDGDGSQNLPSVNVAFHEADLLEIDPDTLVLTTNPQHGVSVPAPDGHYLLSDPNPDGGLPSGFRVLDEQGRTLQVFNDKSNPDASCIGMHGEAVVGAHYLFGCHQDDGGVLVLSYDATQQAFSGRKLTYPDGRRTSVLADHPAQSFAVGQYGRYPDYDALVRIDPTAESIPMDAVQALPARQCSFAFERSHGDQLVVLTEDGYVHAFDPADWTLLGSVQITDPFSCSDSAAPRLVVGEDVAYLTRPDQAQVVEVDLTDYRISRTLTVPGTPGSIAVFGWYGVLEHDH